MKKLALFGMLVLFLIGCVPAGSDVVSASAVDWVWGTEELRSGAVRVWLRHDNIAGYCTTNPQLTSKVQELEGQLVRVEFETIHANDKENWNASGCNRLHMGESSTPIFKLTHIEVYKGRTD